MQANRPAGRGRSRAQQQADAFVQLADNTLAAGNLPILRTVKPHVVVTIDLDDLVDPHTGPGAAPHRLRRAHLRRPGPLAGLRRQHHPDRDRPRGPAAGPGPRPSGSFPPHLRRALDVRDQGCVFAGCYAPTHWCDAHHLLALGLDGGATSMENGALLCERHHTKVHHGFRIERQPDGRWHTYRPDGTEILLHPDRLRA